MEIRKRALINAILLGIVSTTIILIYLKYRYGGYKILDRCESHNFKVQNIRQYKEVLYLNDSLKLANSYNNIKPYQFLNRFIEAGDSVVLESMNDTLYLFRNNKKFWFIYYGEECEQ
nr:hypothetical protein [Allomuricauda sp.]